MADITPRQWARYWLAEKFCAVKRIHGGAVLSHCNGRFPEAHDHELALSPPEKLKCGGCLQALARISRFANDRIEAALEELKANG